MAPSGVNDSARELMAALATWYADHAWVLRGRASAGQSGTQHTVAYGSATTFTTSAGDGDTTAIYHAGRRIRCEVTAGTVVGRVTSSTGNPTTVTVSLDSGSLDSGLDEVYIGPETTNPPIDISGVARAEGAWRFEAQYTPSSASEQDITDLDQSSDHLFVLRDVAAASDGNNLLLRVSPDSGSSPTFDSGASDYAWGIYGVIVGTGSNTGSDAADSSIRLSTNLGNDASLELGQSGHVLLYDVGNASSAQMVESKMTYRNSSNALLHENMGGQRVTAQVTQAVRFIFNTGNIASGTIDHYTRPVQ